MADDDEALVAALCRCDADASASLVDPHSSARVRVAMAYVPSQAAAEEAVQETWIFRILTNIAMRSGARFTKPLPDSNRRPFLTMAVRLCAEAPSVSAFGCEPERGAHATPGAQEWRRLQVCGRLPETGERRGTDSPSGPMNGCPSWSRG
jgi:hypothetical protein